jgi:D-proline reductase (dithiol) PrdB
MPRLEKVPKKLREALETLPCPCFESTPWTPAEKPGSRCLAIISTAGLHRRRDIPFGVEGAKYRIIPDGIAPEDLIMTHVSTNFDRSGFSRDYNVAFPLDRLHELVNEGVIGAAAARHYSFMGAEPPENMKEEAKTLVRMMKGDGVNSVLLVPV